MQRQNSEITFLVDDIEAVLELNRLLEKDNEELKQEVARLKAQVTALTAQDLERKSILWKKIQGGNVDKIKQHETVHQVSSKMPTSPAIRFAAPVPSKKMNEEQLHLKGPPPPPPPLPSQSDSCSKLAALQRVPEVIEFYRHLNKRNIPKEKSSNVTGASGKGINPRNMIGEIEKRSSYLLAVKSAVDTQQEFVSFLIEKVETAAFTEITDVEVFVKWLDEQLSCLVDERAVLKHFPQWPERKTDALREAARIYRDLKNVESEVLMHKDDAKQTLSQSLGRIQALQDRLERVISNTERTRDTGAWKQYKELWIPWGWMLDTGLCGQIKLCSLKLARQYMRRIVTEAHSSRHNDADEFMRQGARFAYRTHQFAGGFDSDTRKTFEDLVRRHSTISSRSAVTK